MALAGCGVAPTSPPEQPAPLLPSPLPHAAPSRAAAESAPVLPAMRVPDTAFAPGLGEIHTAYLAAIGGAGGKPVRADAPLNTGNAVAWHGNTYRVERVSLLLLGQSARVYTGFDPHAPGTARSATAEEVDLTRATLGTGMAHLREVLGGLEGWGELVYTAPACGECHPPERRAPACLVYALPELADD